MRVLVTGGAGYLGSRLVPVLLQQHEVVVLDSFLYGAGSLLGSIGHRSIKIVKGTVECPPKETFRGVDAIIHLAALVGDEACADTARAYATNTKGTEVMLCLARKYAIERFIFASTCSNYGVSVVEADEDSQLSPLTTYAKSKVEAEHLVLDSPVPHTILRMGTLCGTSPRMRLDLLVNEFAYKAALGIPIEVYTPQAWRPFLHITDAVNAFCQIINYHTADVVYNLVGQNITKQDLAALVQAHYPETTMSFRDASSDRRDYRVLGSKWAKRFPPPMRTVEDAFLEVANATELGMFRPCTLTNGQE